MHVVYNHRRVQRGTQDQFIIRINNEYRSPMGIAEETPLDITGWEFELYIHRNVEMNDNNIIYQTTGVVYGSNGAVAFTIPAEETDIKPNVYWYTIRYTRPNGKTYQGTSSKYIIAESLNTYFSLYK